MYVVSAGNPYDGLVLYGPFDDPGEANEWADKELHNEEFHVVEIKWQP